MKKLTDQVFVRETYRCENCGYSDTMRMEPSWNVDERQAAALQHHDQFRDRTCAGFAPRWGGVEVVSEAGK